MKHLEKFKKYGWWAFAAWWIFLALFALFLIVSTIQGQECYPGFVPTPDDPDCDGVISIGIELAVNAVLGTDGLYYLQCLSGCTEFYQIASIDVLYTGYTTGLEALETWRVLLYDFYDWQYVPLPVTP